MSKSGTGTAGFDSDAASYDAAIPSELRSLLTTISHQIDEADQRHTNILQELRDRLRTLSRDAEQVRASVPEGAGTAYARIESGLAQLAMRIDTIDETPQETRMPRTVDAPAPAALRSAAVAGTSGYSTPAEVSRPATPVGAIDPFDLVGEPDEDEVDAAWDRTDAEALTRVYEESDAALVRASPRSPAPVTEDAPAPDEPVASAEAAQVADPLHIYAPADPAPDVGSSDPERTWLEQRLSDIAARIEQSLADLKPGLSVESLGVRFDAFEERMGSVLGDVATRTDLESLHFLEGQIHELASHLEQAERQLGRLDSIEKQLQAVIEHLSEGPAAGAPETGVAAMPDLQALASATAEEVAERFASTLGGRSSETRFDELGGMLRGMMNDRRQSDEQTYTMLDTVQQAMIRLLDRIDALEVSQARAESAAISAAAVPDLQAPIFGPVAGAEQPRTGAPELGHADPAEFVPGVPRYAPAAPAMASAPLAPSSADKLRQDFIADAQRAKMRAAAAADPGAEAGVAVASQRAARGLPRPTTRSPQEPATGAAASAVASRKQRLTALALCLVIAVSGAALLAKSRNKAPPANAPAVTETVPDIAVPGKVTEPAAPQGTAPATADGATFEAPADDPHVVPSPIPAPPAARPQGGGGPVTNPDAPGSDGNVRDGGDVLQHRPDAPHGGMSPKGIILHDSGRTPTVQELVNLQFQQNTAALSSRLGNTAGHLSPADLMPEEVARMQVRPASLGSAREPGDSSSVPATVEPGRTVSPLALPPATVGPLSLRIAAANGDPSAAFEVGARLAEGKGTDQNFRDALTWYQKSAAQGFAQAQYRLGTLYERGLGVKADMGRARLWYQRAAEQGNVKAMHNLAVLSAGRESGTPDYTSAAQWFTAAAEYGLADSQYNLAVLYENGLGVPKDDVQAFKWYALAAASGGDKEAARRRDAFLEAMVEPVRGQAERQVATFRSKRVVPLVNDARVAGEDWKKRLERGGSG